MYFLIDNEKHILFGWSAKCGCTHLKSIFYYLKNDKVITNYKIHQILPYSKIPRSVMNSIYRYDIVIISRNPFDRLVSGFLDKYHTKGQYRHMWPYKTITFRRFVNKLGNWKYIQKHHFIKQTSEGFNNNITRSKSIKCYDVKNIDYNYIEMLYNKKLPKELLEFKHSRNKTEQCILNDVYDLNMDDYFNYNISYDQYYNKELKQKVYEFYKDDFIFFQKYGLNYQ